MGGFFIVDKMNVMEKFYINYLRGSLLHFIRYIAVFSVIFTVSSYCSSTYAQEGVLMRNMLESVGILNGSKKEKIDYKDRPALVVPKELDKLPEPESSDIKTKNKQWPKDPDVMAREEEKARSNQSILLPSIHSPEEGGRLSPSEMAARRAQRGTKLQEAQTPLNDKDGVRLSAQEMGQISKQSSNDVSPTQEPTRNYLTDPPVGMRVPSKSAPVGKRTMDGPVVDDGRVRDAWKPQE